MGTHVALLRGINLGGKNKLPMKDLANMFTAAGCTNVQTYIQSGNVVFQASDSLAVRVPDVIQRAIRDEFGLNVPVVTRTAEALRSVVDHNPFHKAGEDPELLHVAFLADEPAKAQVDALDPNRSPPDRFVVRGRDVYLCLPNGMAKTKLSNAYFDSKLKTVSTARNWRTTLKLLEMAAG